MIKIKRALISVTDKAGVVDLARELQAAGAEILSTGGTAEALRRQGIAVKEVSQYTGFPEMLEGRVKTLHPMIHGGLLALRENKEHLETLNTHAIGLIDMVVVNLYPFEKTVQKPGVSRKEAIENIDIGGPSMLRSAAKNHRSVAVVCDPARYPEVIAALRKNRGALPEGLLRGLAREAFALTSRYDRAIYEYLNRGSTRKGLQDQEGFPPGLELHFEKVQDLRYGENPHQKAAFYKEKDKTAGLIKLRQLQGKELSFNNILDLNAAWELVQEFRGPAAAVVKHNNPCGVAESTSLAQAFRSAWACDTLSAFGGIVALNRTLDQKTAQVIAKSGFLECIIAPGFQEKALASFKEKKNLRLIALGEFPPGREYDFKRVSGGLLLQEKDRVTLDTNTLRVVTKKKPTKKQMEGLLFAWKVAKHVKSNAIVLTQGAKTVGIGAGQMSRVDSVAIARKKAGVLARNSCLASDAFFPKEDAVAQAAQAGVKAIIQPGGSIADPEIIKACDKRGIAMVFTGIRHFKH